MDYSKNQLVTGFLILGSELLEVILFIFVLLSYCVLCKGVINLFQVSVYLLRECCGE